MKKDVVKRVVSQVAGRRSQVAGRGKTGLIKKKRVNSWRMDWEGVLFWTMVLLVVLVVWFWIFSYEDCNDKACFNEALKDCDQAKFAYGNGMIFEYTIKGEEDKGCEVVVKLLQGDLNNADSEKLEGYDMSCVLPLGVVMDPESDISNCHGLLKEGLQELIINKMYNYLVQNLGRLNLEMVEIPKSVVGSR